MINLIAQNGHVSYGIKEYVCDTTADLSALPIDGKAGSTAFIIEDSTTYILNSKGEWKKKKNFNNGGSNEELEAEIEALQAQNAELTAANEQLTKGNQVLIATNESLTAQNYELTTEIGDLNTQIVELTAEKVALSDEVAELIISNTDLSNEVGTLTNQVETLTAENENLKKEIEDLTEFVPSTETNTLSVPATSTMIQDTTLVISEENSEVVGNKLILD